MKLADFSLLDAEVVKVSLDGLTDSGQHWKAGAEAKLWIDDNGTWLSQGDALAQVKAAGGGLELLLRRKELPWLLLQNKGSQIHLQCAQPSDWLPLDEVLEICVDEKVAGQLARAGIITKDDVPLAVTWCQEQFLLDGNPQRLAAVRHESASPHNWQIVGSGWRADLQRSSEGKILVNRVAPSPGVLDAWSLIQGEIRFVNSSAATQMMSEGQQAQLRLALQTHGDYIKLWRRYSEQEWQKSLSQAAGIGVLTYKKREEASQEGGVWRFFVAPEELEKFRAAWQSLESDGSLALEANTSRPDWHHASYQDLTQSDNNRRFRGRPRFEGRSIVIDSDRNTPPDEGYLYLSLAGDRTVQERRQKALANIETSARSLKLRYILQGVPVPTPRITRYEAITSNTRECFKNGKPTDSQKQAIKMALETPDIALIIGPPGTGKTQVIAALSRRLSEIGGDSGIQHQVLITSFQHDAVENALERTQVYDLPPVKVGQRASGESLDPIRLWCDQQYEKLGAIIDTQSEKEGHAPLLRALHQYLATLRHGQLDGAEQRGLLDAVEEILKELEGSYRLRLPPLLREEWIEYLERVPRVAKIPKASKRDDQQSLTLRKVRALRVTPLGFFDDGPCRASDAYLAIQFSGSQVAPEDLEELRRLEISTELNEAGAIAAAALRDRLVDALSDYRPPIIRHRLDAEGLRLAGAIEDALEDRLKSTRQGIGGVLARYRDTFVNHPSRSRETVREYAMVVGATCQQAASVAMASLKNLSGIGDVGITFETVIIDEAARANPLDLFIPMSMAEKRVILVGDHRQLPHLLEPEVENELVETHSLTEDQRKAFKDSLFERLWRQLKDRENADGFSRVVMLDTQFRMHPILGEFVSKQFYESVGLAPLKPGRNTSDFMDSIPGYEGKVCGWLNVSLMQGKKDERRGGSSHARKEEARRIAKEVERLLNACGSEISIGVITFYSAQRDVIFEELANSGITERNEESGEWQVTEPWTLTSHQGERLRIGTVDAFQGKEFDIVLLSVVRSNDFRLPKEGLGHEGYEKAANRKYGHLRLSNRMNVAMSRQRSLLVAVGDSAMAQGGGAESAVPALAEFLKLCGGEHGFIR